MRGLLTRDRVDAVFALVLGVVASLGFRQTFHGDSYLVAAVAGLVLGIALAWLAHSLRQPLVLLAVFTIAAFFLLGGAVALHTDGVTAMLPLPHTLSALADASVHGWKDLLTTLAPVDGGPLLTLPYLMTLVAGAATMAVAVRTRSVLWPLLPPTAYLAGVILLGIQTPSRAALLGAVYGVVALTWIAVRHRRVRATVLSGRSPWLQRGLAVVMVLGCAALATVVHLPGTGHARVVLRSYVSPPFDVGQYPSPLAGFRKYTKGYQAPSGDPEDHLYEQTLLTVHGLPAGTLLRLAALDDYDGSVWAAASQSPGTTGADGAFQRVGTVIPEAVSGRHVSARVTIDKAYDGQVWLPSAGAATRLELPRSQQDQFRYNLATDTGIVPGGLTAGESYSFDAVVPTGPSSKVDAQMTPDASGASLDTGNADFGPVAARWGQGASEPVQRVLSIARYLHDTGRYTDGGPGEEQYAAGHSVARLSKFSAEGVDPTGDDEQYAAMLALLANQIGVPARAVIGAEVPASGVVKGADVHAWVELRDDRGVWRTLPTDAFMSTERPPVDTPPQPQQLVSGQVVPPPAPVRPPATNGDPYATTQNHHTNQTHHSHVAAAGRWLLAVGRYAAPPLLVVLLVVGAILGAKALRRRLRRTRGAPAHRLANAWRELVDHARDLGYGVTGRSTRREQAGEIGLAGFTDLARVADRHVFGAADPTEADAASYWSDVDRLRGELMGGVSRWRRARAALSLASFRQLRPVRPPAREAKA